MANRERVFDEMLCFLSEAIFQIPVRSFMDENCLVFDTENEVSDEHMEIFRQYKTLVDKLLEAFCTDAKITIDDAIKGISRLNKIPDLHDVFNGLFEQVLAATDFKMFYALMVKRNIMIQEQVLAMILTANGVLPFSLTRDSGSGHSVVSRSGSKSRETAGVAADDKQEEELLRIVMERSKAEQSNVPKRTEQLCLKTVELSQQEVKSLAAERAQIEQKMQQLAINEDTATSGRPPLSSAKSSSKSLTTEQAASAWLKSAESESNAQSSTHTALAASLSKLSPEEIRQRQDFLRQQRDKLLAMKKDAREKQLLEAERTQQGSKRPVSARAARSAMREGPDGQTETSAENERKMAMRRAIAEKLREEVVGK